MSYKTASQHMPGTAPWGVSIMSIKRHPPAQWTLSGFVTVTQLYIGLKQVGNDSSTVMQQCHWTLSWSIVTEHYHGTLNIIMKHYHWTLLWKIEHYHEVLSLNIVMAHWRLSWSIVTEHCYGELSLNIAMSWTLLESNVIDLAFVMKHSWGALSWTLLKSTILDSC